MIASDSAIRRLQALVSDRIDWPASPGIDTAGDPARGWDGPYLAGTWLHVGDAGRNLAERWAECRGWYPDRTDEECRAMRDYYAAHRDLFRSQAWYDALTSTATATGSDGLPLLRADLRAILARLAATEAALAEAIDTWTPLAQCYSEAEGDALTAFEGRVRALLGDARTG